MELSSGWSGVRRTSRGTASPDGAVRVTVAGTEIPPPAGRRKIPVLSSVAGSRASLKSSSTGALISAFSAPAAGTVETTTGKASSSTRSPVSKTSPLVPRLPVKRISPAVDSRVPVTEKRPTVTGENEKRPSAPVTDKIEPSALLAEVKPTSISAPAAGVFPSGRTNRPVTVPLAVRIRFFVATVPGVGRETWAWAPCAWEKAASSTVPMGRLSKRKRPSLSAIMVVLSPPVGTDTITPSILTALGTTAST